MLVKLFRFKLSLRQKQYKLTFCDSIMTLKSNRYNEYEYNKILIKLNNQFGEMEALLRTIEKDIQLTPLFFSVLQFLLGGILFILFLIAPYSQLLAQIISIPKTLSLLLSILSGWWCYYSYSSVRIAYRKYRRARQNLIYAKSIKIRIKRLLELLSNQGSRIGTSELRQFTRYQINPWYFKIFNK